MPQSSGDSVDGQYKGGRCLYEPQFEHDACGVGFVASIAGEKSHDIVRHGISVLEHLRHRGASGGDGATGQLFSVESF